MVTEPDVAAYSTEETLVVAVSGTFVDADDASLGETIRLVPPGGSVIFDMRELRLLTAAGVRILKTVVDALRSRNVRCRLVIDPTTAVAAVARDGFSTTTTVSIVETVEQALAGVAGEPAAVNLVESGSDVLSTRLASLTRALVAETTVGGVLRRVVAASSIIVPGADLVSVTLRDPTGAFFTPAQTGPEAAALDQVQYNARAGPCIDAARSDGPAFATSPDLAEETRWPKFAEAAIDRGLASVLSTALLPAASPTGFSGALNIYSRHVDGLRERDRRAALLLATHAALALAYTNATELADMRVQHLRRAIETRDVIGQAKGILMARQGMTADEAFELLRRTSQDLNVKLVDLARMLAERPDGLDMP